MTQNYCMTIFNGKEICDDEGPNSKAFSECNKIQFLLSDFTKHPLKGNNREAVNTHFTTKPLKGQPPWNSKRTKTNLSKIKVLECHETLSVSLKLLWSVFYPK